MSTQTLAPLSDPMVRTLRVLANDPAAIVSTNTAVALIRRGLIGTREQDETGQSVHRLTDDGRSALSRLDGTKAPVTPVTEPLPRRVPLNSPLSVAGRTMSPINRAAAYAATNARNGMRVTHRTPAQARRMRKAANRAAGRGI